MLQSFPHTKTWVSPWHIIWTGPFISRHDFKKPTIHSSLPDVMSQEQYLWNRSWIFTKALFSALCYGSPCWFASRGDMRKIEQLQRRVTKWVLPWKCDCSERLLLNLLPIPMYNQVLDVLTLVKMCNGGYDIDPQFTFKLGRARSRDCRIIPHIEYRSTELQYQEFFVRTCCLINYLPAVDVTQPFGLKPKLLSIFRTFFPWKLFRD